MSWIRETDQQIGSIMNVMSINPAALEAVRGVSQAITFGGSCLTRVQEEAISTVVSTINRCRY